MDINFILHVQWSKGKNCVFSALRKSDMLPPLLQNFKTIIWNTLNVIWVVLRKGVQKCDMHLIFRFNYAKYSFLCGFVEYFCFIFRCNWIFFKKLYFDEIMSIFGGFWCLSPTIAKHVFLLHKTYKMKAQQI